MNGTGKGSTSGSNGLRYDKMVERALRGVVREALEFVAEHGMRGNHHFYLTFRTHFPGVQIPDYLRNEYPDTMTIVLQHQYWGLDVTPEQFAVTLSFRKVHERLTVPFEAMAAFADPSVNFALQFDTLEQKRAAERPQGTGRAAGHRPQLHGGGGDSGEEERVASLPRGRSGARLGGEPAVEGERQSVAQGDFSAKVRAGKEEEATAAAHSADVVSFQDFRKK